MKTKTLGVWCLLLALAVSGQTNKPDLLDKMAAEYKLAHPDGKPKKASENETNAPIAKTGKNILPDWVTEPIIAKKLNEIGTQRGANQINVGIAKIEPDALTFCYSITNHALVMGNFKVRLAEVSTNLQREFGYDPQKSMGYENRKVQLAAAYQAYQAELQKAQTQLDYEEKEIEYETAKEEYDDFLKEEQADAFRRMADAQERQADAQEQQVDVLKDQNFQLQMMEIEQPLR